MNSIHALLFKEASSNYSLLGNLLLDELNSFQSKCLEPLTAVASSSTNYYVNPDTSGTLVPVSTTMESYSQLLANRKSYTFNKYTLVFDDVIKKILTLSGKYTFKQALLEIDKFRTKAGPHFYGAMLKSGNNKIINPFHILTPISYVKSPDSFKGEFTILLYFYRNRSSVQQSLGSPTSNSTTYIDSLLNNIIRCSNHKTEVVTPNIFESTLYYPSVNLSEYNYRGENASGYLNNLQIQVISANEITKEQFDKIDHTNSNNSSSSKSQYLVAHQVMVNGVFAPEYAVSLLSKSTSSLNGTFITPTVSANIQSASTSGRLTWASVCTGRESKSTLEGISSLHCSNFASAYNSSTHSCDSLILADRSIAKSVEIYQKLKLLPTQLPTTPTPEERALVSDFMAYIQFMTDTYQLDLLQIEARYQLILGQTNEQTIEQTTPDSSGHSTEIPF